MGNEELVRKVLEACERIAPHVPDVDPTDLIHIVERQYRPFGDGKLIFLRQLRPGCYVF